MPFEYHIHHDLRLVYRKVWGIYTDDDSRSAHEYWDQLRNENAVNDYNELQDLTEVTEYGISVEQIRTLAAHYRRVAEQQTATGRSPDKKIAYVVPTRLAYGTARVYGALIEETGMVFRVFDTLPDACDWLEVTEAARQNILLSYPS